jgi:hypothetical protein
MQRRPTTQDISWFFGGGPLLPDSAEVIAASVYRRNALGASTDLAQRKARHEILLDRLKA